VVRVPYPAGFLFPQSNLSTAFRVGADSTLDPFLWIQAMEDRPLEAAIEGGASHVVSSTGERFAYRYRIPPPGDGAAVFEYENHSQRGAFRLHALSSVALTRSRGGGGPDTVSFAGFGIWTKDGRRSIQQCAVQISRSSRAPYVGIQIDSGNVSNVNTRPEDERLARP
jgi:hypothetical protein